MNRKIVFYLVGVITILIGVSIFASALVSFIMKDDVRDGLALLACGFLVIVPAVFLAHLMRPKNEADRKFGAREGFACVAFGWLAASIAGTITYMAVTNFGFADAFFESVSGFTTIPSGPA